MRVPRPVWRQMRREAFEARLTLRDYMSRVLQDALVTAPCICDYNHCNDDPCYGNCGCVACRRLGERE